MAYDLVLTDNEKNTLAWCTDRGYFPEEAYDALTLADGEPEEVGYNTPRNWTMPEHAAWSIGELRENDPCACFACIGGDLLTRLLDLEESIV